MHFPKYWTITKQKNMSAWGWSDESLAHATAKAEERLTRIRDWLARGGKPAMQQRYGYSDRPMREEVLREFCTPEGTLRAAVTRNSYGCLVLNTTDLMFVDVDAPEAKATGFFAGLFGVGRAEQERQATAFANSVVTRVNVWIKRWPNWGWRVYRTAAGVRLLATNEPFASDHAMCQTAFEVFEADPLYRKLCATQKCFRARLTPKPWRCNLDKPRWRWPWKSEKYEARFRKWEAQYNQVTMQYATCRLVGQFGGVNFDPTLCELVEFHDQATRAESGRPLA